MKKDKLPLQVTTCGISQTHCGVNGPRPRHVHPARSIYLTSGDLQIHGLQWLLLMFSHSVMSDSLWPRGLQHARLLCPVLSPGFAQNHVHWVGDAIQSNHVILCCPLLLLPSIFPSIRVFSKESVLHIRWPQYGSCSLSISPSSECPGLISFGMDWLDFLAVQGLIAKEQHHAFCLFTFQFKKGQNNPLPPKCEFL